MKKCCVLEYVVLKTKTNWTEIRRYKPGYDSHVIAVKLFLADAVCLLSGGRGDLYASRRIEPLPDFARFYHFLDLALKTPAW